MSEQGIVQLYNLQTMKSGKTKSILPLEELL